MDLYAFLTIQKWSYPNDITIVPVSEQVQSIQRVHGFECVAIFEENPIKWK